jgi:nucleotide-binding universal stress UspA family protein
VYRHILVGLDGEPSSQLALKQAIGLARLCGASLSAISVVEKLPAYAASVGEVEEAKLAMERYLARIQATAVDVARSAGIEMKTALRAGNAAQAITNYAAENDVDLIVLGADGRKGLGSTADRVTESATCSVLIARINLPTLRVRDAMTREVAVVAPDTPLSDLVRLMVERQLKATPVLEAGNIVGIITGGDLLARSGMGLRLSLQRALPAAEFAEQIRALAAEGKTAKDVMTSRLSRSPRMSE